MRLAHGRRTGPLEQPAEAAADGRCASRRPVDPEANSAPTRTKVRIVPVSGRK